jgi:hypothetical protein
MTIDAALTPGRGGCQINGVLFKPALIKIALDLGLQHGLQLSPAQSGSRMIIPFGTQVSMPNTSAKAEEILFI